MIGVGAVSRNLVWTGFVVAACLVLAFAIAVGMKLPAVALLGLVVITPLVSRSPENALLVWVATGPTLGGWLAIVPGGGLPAVTPDRVILIFLAAVLVVRWVRRPGTLLAPGRIEWLMLAFVALGAISAIAKGGTSRFPGDGGLRVDFIFLMQPYAIPFLAFFLSKSLLTGDRRLQDLLDIYVGVGVFIALVAILNYYTGITTFLPTRYNVINEGRATGTLASSRHLGMILSAGVIPALIMLRRSRSLVRTLTLLSTAALMIFAMYLSKTRASYVGLLAGLSVAAIHDHHLRRPLVAAMIVVTLALIVVWPVVVESDFVQHRLLESVPVYARFALGVAAVNMFLDKPILGHGFGRYTFYNEHPRYLMDFAGISRHYAQRLGVPHNEFLQIAVLLGLAGLVPYVIIFVLCWRCCSSQLRRRSSRSPTEHDVVLIALALLAMYLLNGFFGGLAFCWYGANMVFVLLGIAEGLRVRDEDRSAFRTSPLGTAR